MLDPRSFALSSSMGHDHEGRRSQALAQLVWPFGLEETHRPAAGSPIGFRSWPQAANPRASFSGIRPGSYRLPEGHEARAPRPKCGLGHR